MAPTTSFVKSKDEILKWKSSKSQNLEVPFNKKIPILAVTANAFETDKVTALEAGCNGFLTKPVNKQELIKEIEKLAKSSVICGGGG